MPTTLPETTKSLGRRTVWIVPEAGIANPEAISAAELAAGFTATAFIYGNGAMVTGEQQKGNAPKKLSEVTQRQQLGVVNLTVSDIQYSYKAQAADADPANGMKAACVEGTRVYVVDRLGVLEDAAPASGQYVNAALVVLGRRNKTQTGDDEYAEFSITQSATVENSYDDVVLGV